MAPGVALPPSLRNIFKEMQRDLGTPPRHAPHPGGKLVEMGAAGRFVAQYLPDGGGGQPASHANKGWEALTDAVIGAVSSHGQPCVFMLWGSHAQSKRALVDASRHLVLTANHPSPLSALRPPQPLYRLWDGFRKRGAPFGDGMVGPSNKNFTEHDVDIFSWHNPGFTRRGGRVVNGSRL